ncbi:MAG: cysteine desulfurase family protein [Trueperaceae bacterium]
MEIYLDHAASTPVHPEVQQAVSAVLNDSYGNPSSIHTPGRRARRVVEEAREAVAASINARPNEIIFTSGATEADNLALRGVLPCLDGGLLTSPFEHSAVLAAARSLEASGCPVTYLAPSPTGEIDLAAVGQALEESGAGLVALMLVNNETGVRTPIERLSGIVHDAGALLFCDAVQAFGFEQVDVRALGVDALALSAHKAYGPKGVGALWLRDGVELSSVTYGGGQERGLRPGTHDTPAIAGMGAAARMALGAGRHGEEVAELRDLFEAAIAGEEGLTVNAAGVARGPKHSSVSVAGVEGEALLMSLDAEGVYVSAGSACSAGSIEASHVLRAMGLSEREAKATMRFSFGAAVSREGALAAAERFLAAVQRCRAFAA